MESQKFIECQSNLKLKLGGYFKFIKNQHYVFNDLDVRPANQVCPVKLLKIRYKKLVDNLLNQIKIK